MQDVFGFVGDSPLTQTFWPRGTGSEYQTWEKPRGISFVYIIVVSGGGGGGNGFSAAQTNARGGGGGGSAGTLARIFFPALVLPDYLYVRAGAGGPSTTSGTGSEVAGAMTGNIPFTLMNPGGGNNGGNGTGAAVGAAGSSVTAINAGAMAEWGLYQVTGGGYAGVAGGAVAGAAGANNVVQALSGGAGGAGTTSADFAGGNVNSNFTAGFPTLSGGAAGSNSGQNGNFRYGIPLFFGQGGSGGGSSNTGVGGAGGNGAPGCGGGGGGGGTTGGAGGRGGPGFVIIICS